MLILLLILGIYAMARKDDLAYPPNEIKIVSGSNKLRFALTMRDVQSANFFCSARSRIGNRAATLQSPSAVGLRETLIVGFSVGHHRDALSETAQMFGIVSALGVRTHELPGVVVPQDLEDPIRDNIAFRGRVRPVVRVGVSYVFVMRGGCCARGRRSCRRHWRRIGVFRASVGESRVGRIHEIRAFERPR